MDSEGIITIDGEDYALPDGIKQIGEDDLYEVDRELIKVALPPDIADLDSAVDDYFNARHFTKKGFDPESMDQLYTSIIDNGLMNPLMCRWVVNDDELSLQVVEGERRITCIEKILSEEKRVWSRSSSDYLPASEVFDTVLSRIVIATPKEALQYAWTYQENTVDWGDAAKTVTIYKMRSQGFTDDEILEITGKSLNWLREEDKICQLDKKTFSFYIEGKIIRKVALDLAKTENEEIRERLLEKSYAHAEERFKEENKNLDKEIEAAENREEIAEAELAFVEQVMDDEEKINEAKEKLEKAEKKTSEKRKKKTRKPAAKTKDLTAASSEVVEEEIAAGNEPPDQIVQPLRPGAMRASKDEMSSILEEDGMMSVFKEVDGEQLEEEILISPEILRYCIAVTDGFLAGTKDVKQSLEKQWRAEKRRIQAEKLLAIRNERIAVTVEAEDEFEDEEFEDDDI